MTKLGSFLSDDAGASAAEYALILAVICTAIVASLMFLKHAIASATKYTANEIPPR
jgi:Flp pilus assembly pilin Flp